jgi:hypothetical protein
MRHNFLLKNDISIPKISDKMRAMVKNLSRKFIFLCAGLSLSLSALASGFQQCCINPLTPITTTAASKLESSLDTEPTPQFNCHQVHHKKTSSTSPAAPVSQKNKTKTANHHCSMPCCKLPLTDTKVSLFKLSPVLISYASPSPVTILKVAQFNPFWLKPPILHSLI